MTMKTAKRNQINEYVNIKEMYKSICIYEVLLVIFGVPNLVSIVLRYMYVLVYIYFGWYLFIYYDVGWCWVTMNIY